MAETTTTAPAAAADNQAASAGTRPTKPDDNAFKADLAKLEKEHKDAMDRFVSTSDGSHEHLASGPNHSFL